MNKFLTIAMLTFACYLNMQGGAVTYAFSGGRLGDNLVSYAHARYVSYKYNLPLVYKPFEYADQLKLSQQPQIKDMVFEKEVIIPSEPYRTDLDNVIKSQENALYVIKYFPEKPGPDSLTDDRSPDRGHFDVDWQDEKFVEILRNEISPISPVPQHRFPQDRTSVAVHMRFGIGFDRLLQNEEVKEPDVFYADVNFPLKFPPFEYYVEQIQRIAQLLNNQPLYVYIFTDHPNPQELLERCREAVKNPSILFESRESDNRLDVILDEFFALTQFDCLIRGHSNYSIMASKLGRYKIQVSPKSSRWEGTKLIITDTYMTQEKRKEEKR